APACSSISAAWPGSRPPARPRSRAWKASTRRWPRASTLTFMDCRCPIRRRSSNAMKLTIPTWLTLLRIVMIPVLVLVFYLPYKWTNFAAAAIFGLAAITDWLDGWVARRYELHSAFGAFLDPVADKLMVAVALFLIVQGHPTPWMAFWAAVIVGREIAVSALREWMA